jgi:hypothetical protein
MDLFEEKYLPILLEELNMYYSENNSPYYRTQVFGIMLLDDQIRLLLLLLLPYNKIDDRRATQWSMIPKHEKPLFHTSPSSACDAPATLSEPMEKFKQKTRSLAH